MKYECSKKFVDSCGRPVCFSCIVLERGKLLGCNSAIEVLHALVLFFMNCIFR